MSSKFFSFSRNQGVVMVTVFFLVAIGAIYFFKYVPNRQRELEEKQFRGLQNIESNVSRKIDNSLALLKTLSDAYVADSPNYRRVAVKAYAKSFPEQNFTVDVNVLPAPKKQDSTQKNIDTSSVEFNNREVILRLIKEQTEAKMTYTMQQFMEPLLSKDMFNEYILFNNNKDIIYQTFPSGISTNIIDSLKSSFSKGQIKDVIVSGTTYKPFIQQLHLNSTTTITIAGLLTKESYDAERNKLPGSAVLLLLTIAIAGILALPWIKLYQVGNKDRLTWADGLLSFGVSMLLMSILFFALFSYNSSWRPGVKATEKSGKVLAGKIKKAFGAEISRVYTVLDTADKLINKPGIGKIESDAVGTLYGAQLKKITKGISVSQIFQLDKKGIEVYNWSPGGQPSPAGNFSNRAYFLNLRDKKPFYLNGDARSKFSLEQVISWTTGTFTTVLARESIKNKAVPYIAISFDLKCLDRPILPAGFIYSIVDERGQVLYHSNVSRQLNENLFNEFSDHTPLKAAIEARADVFFKTDYAGKNYSAFVSPISDLPYSVVILEDNAYTGIRELNNFCFSYFMLFGFFFILAIELLLVFIVSYKKRYYKKRHFDISWIGPNERFHQQYNISSVGNILTIILLFGAFFCTTFLQYVFILLLAATMSFIFITCLYILGYDDDDDPGLISDKRNGLIALGIAMLIINLFAANFTKIVPVLVFQGMLGIILLLLGWYHKETKNNRSTNNRGSWNFSSSFSLMTFTRLIITSGLPVVSFYIATTTYEVKLISRYRHTEFLKSLQRDTSIDLDHFSAARFYLDSVWIVKVDTASDTINHANTADDYCANALFKKLMIGADDLMPEIKELDHDAADTSLIYSSLFKQGVARSYYYYQNKKHFHVESANLWYTLPNAFDPDDWFVGIIYWLVFFGALGGFWFVLHHILRKLFALNITSEAYWDDIDTLLLTHNTLNSLVFLIGSPGSGKLGKVKKLIEKELINDKNGNPIIDAGDDQRDPTFIVIDMILIPNGEDSEEEKQLWEDILKKADKDQYKLIIVNHFEYDIKNPKTNTIKLNLLEALLQKNKSKLLVISTVHPVNFLDSLNQEQSDKAKDQRQPEHELERWHVLLGHFNIAIERLKNCEIKFSEDMAAWKRILLYETRNTHFLQRLREPVLEKLKEKQAENLKKGEQIKELDGDSLSAKLGVTSHYFYMYVWQSLTKEEKFLLYDLAEDGLVNPYDDYNLTLLISKGLIIRENNILKIFNNEFRNFILTAIGHAEVVQIQQQIKDTGNWGKLKVPLLILIVAVLIFLFTSQKEAYSTLLKYLAIITAGVPIVLNTLSLLKPKPKDGGSGA
ncbi:hypothetical protein GCM10023149_23080 [Mucilaginibacter gynuensis]|uniref:Cache domain-containing protein n=1 Tax=Mucilaginibacter gynuensis TaxID=1302236 RepID=A0ABP8GDZ1_9SPHI